MMRKSVLWLVLSSTALVGIAMTIPVGQPASAAVTASDLRTRLEKELLAVRPSDFAFVNRVIFLVDIGVLPRPLVNSTYLWARKRPRHRFQYFERALRLRARTAGIKL